MPSSYSTTPMSRFQFLMLRAVEGGASLSEAFDAALRWGVRHPDLDLFEHRPYPGWQAGRDDGDDGQDRQDRQDPKDRQDHQDHQDRHDQHDQHDREAASVEPEGVEAAWASAVDPS